MAIGTEKNDGYAVICDHCEAQGPIVSTPRRAIARWNQVISRLPASKGARRA
jgi:hypothetical protein